MSDRIYPELKPSESSSVSPIFPGTQAECDYLINLAKPHMQKWMVAVSSSGKSKDTWWRSSSGTFLPRGRDKIIRDIEKRVADFSFIPVYAV
uniref:Uncharacterized protein n=1 Tax=Salix viminalis TaxID=40686 RepID=A0A6N2NAF5_SALVM